MKQLRYQPIELFDVISEPGNPKPTGLWFVWDNLEFDAVPNSEKASFDLADEVCQKMNRDYEEAMERQRKKIFEKT